MGCYRTILVAVDGSPDAAAALEHATSLARDQHAKLILLTIIPSAPPKLVSPGVPVPPTVDSERAYAQILREAVDSLPPDIGVQTQIGRGRPAKRILEIAQRSDCDLIVMGFHGHGRLHHALIGSTSGTVLLGSHLPVLLMRGAKSTPAVTVDEQELAATPRGDLRS